MRRMDSIGLGRMACSVALATLAALSLAVAPAAAVNFDSTGTGFVETPELLALPNATIDFDVPFFFAGQPGGGGSFDVEFMGSAAGSVCILLDSAPNVCRIDLGDGSAAYSALVTLEISALNTMEISGPFTLMVTKLELVNPGSGDTFLPSEISVALGAMAPMSLDTSGVPGFNFDGTFTPLVRIEDTACANSGGNCDYLGWTVTGVGDTVTFRFDVSTAPGSSNTPRLVFNAIPVVVPEPGTAVLMALGLAGLSRAERRMARNRA